MSHHTVVGSPLDTGLPRGLKTNKGDFISTDYVAVMKPTSRDTPMQEIRRRLREEGYVLVKNLIPREDVLDIRECYFSKMATAHMLKPGSSPREGIFNSAMDPDEAAGIGSVSGKKLDIVTEKCHEAHSTQEYLSFLGHPALREFIRELMRWDEDVLCTRTLLRHSVPGASSTGIHYDKIFLRDGGAEFLTAWVPIGDIAIDGGGLAYLENSSELGQKTESDYAERAKDFSLEQRISAYNDNMAVGGLISEDAVDYTRTTAGGRRWLISNYEAGDVVFHDQYMIHTATVNQSAKGIIRLSTDLRFYEKGADMDERWMKFWFPGDGL